MSVVIYIEISDEYETNTVSVKKERYGVCRFGWSL